MYAHNLKNNKRNIVFLKHRTRRSGYSNEHILLLAWLYLY